MTENSAATNESNENVFHNERPIDSGDFFEKACKKLDVSKEQTEGIFNIFFGNLIRCLNSQDATTLLSHLPVELKEKLADNPSGPDKTISSELIAADLRSYGVPEGKTSTALIKECWDFLESYVKETPHLNPGALTHIRSKLPRDIRDIFTYGVH